MDYPMNQSKFSKIGKKKMDHMASLHSKVGDKLNLANTKSLIST
jgi:hypothetical protein